MNMSDRDSTQMMREMRNLWLAMKPQQGHDFKNDDVLAVVMDWPLGEACVTVFSSVDGDASLYTTSNFGILGGIKHEKVRKAAIEMVHCAQHFLGITQPATQYPYPDNQTLCFYMVTPSGVRTVSFPLNEVEKAESPALALFAYAQQVVTELRLITTNQNEGQA